MTRRPRAIPVLLTVAAFALAGCGESGNREATVTDSAGVQIVVNPETGLWGSTSPWTVEQDLIIGASEGEAAYQFGQIAGVDIGADGRVYVMDQQAREIRVFSPRGDHVATFGQPGSGPGELSQAAGPVFVTPGDTVVVPDMMQQRITRYTAAGQPAGSHPLPMAGGLAVKWMETPQQDLIQQTTVMAFPGQENVEQKNLLVRRRPTGEVVDTILEMPIGRSVSFAGSTPSITLFESEPMWTVGPTGEIYTGINSEYSVNVHSPQGEVTRIVRKAFRPRAISDRDQNEFRRIIRGLWEDQGMPPEALDMMAQALNFADSYPAFANLLGGPEGTLWVQRIQTPDDVMDASGTFDIQDMGSAAWEIFDAQGQYLGVLEMPPRFTPMAFIGEHLYGVLRDDLDVQYVVRMVVDTGRAAGE